MNAGYIRGFWSLLGAVDRRERIHGILELLKSLTVGQLDLKFQRTLDAGINGQARPKADTTKACATPTLDADSQIALGIGHD